MSFKEVAELKLKTLSDEENKKIEGILSSHLGD